MQSDRDSADPPGVGVAAERRGLARWWRPIALGLTVVGALVLVTTSDVVLNFVVWVRQAGWVGVLAFGGIYVVATVLMVPGSVLTLGAGFVYGPLWGTLLVSPASVTGATLAFLLSRGQARAWVAARMARRPMFAAVDRAIEAEGFKTVLLLRLSPVFPFVLLNYALGLTQVRLVHFVAASVLGMLPASVLFVYLGSLIRNVSELTSGHQRAGVFGQLLFAGGLMATLVVTWTLTRAAKRTLARSLDPHR